MHWNADGIGNIKHQLQDYLVNSNVEVLTVQDSKLLSTGPIADKDPIILEDYGLLSTIAVHLVGDIIGPMLGITVQRSGFSVVIKL